MYSLCNAPVYQVFHNKTSSNCTADEIYFKTEPSPPHPPSQNTVVQDIKISDK